MGSLWDTKYHGIIHGKKVLKHPLVQPLVHDGHKFDQNNYPASIEKQLEKGSSSNDHTFIKVYTSNNSCIWDEIIPYGQHNYKENSKQLYWTQTILCVSCVLAIAPN